MLSPDEQTTNLPITWLNEHGIKSAMKVGQQTKTGVTVTS